MKHRVLKAEHPQKSQTWTIKKERSLIGRDSACDIVLDDNSISRKQAYLIFQFESVYIENISNSGFILKNQDVIEYAQLEENEIVEMGPFRLFWTFEESSAESPPPSMNNTEESSELKAEASSENEPNMDFLPQEIGPSEEAPVDANASTRIISTAFTGKLKIIKGEKENREILLEHGSLWIVGRADSCTVPVDNAKLSRQHFRIERQKNQFKIVDLDSSHGIRVNGVSVKEAPLNPFDVISAGPVDFQFLLANSREQAALFPSTENENFQQQILTATKAPPSEPHPEYAISPYHAPQDISSVPTSAPAATAQLNNGNSVTENPTLPSFVLWNKIKTWYQDLPTSKQRLYAVLSLALLGLLAYGLLAEDNTEKNRVPSQIQKPELSHSNTGDNAADPKEASADFYSLPIEQQNQIREWHAQAERSVAEGNWEKAEEFSKKILDKVKRYKNAAEILQKAQTHQNEDHIGTFTQSALSAAEAAKDNNEKIKIFIDEGKKALSENRWTDAAELFMRALNLDPTNEEATRGWAAAQAKTKDLEDEKLKQSKNLNLETEKLNEEQEALQKEKDELYGLKKQLEDAQEKFSTKSYNEALIVLKDLREKITQVKNEYESGSRAPASAKTELVTESKNILMHTQELYSKTNDQLKSDFGTQLTDAEQFIGNRQYSEARNIYDKILSQVENFEEAKVLREVLYKKMIIEARAIYQEALVYETVSDLENAITGYKKTEEMLRNIDNPTAIEYYRKAGTKLRRYRP